MKNYIQKGGTIEVVAGGNVASGSIVTVGTIAGISSGNYVSGNTVVVNLDGVYAVAKDASVVAQGAKLYVAAGVATTTVGTNVFLGYAHVAALTGDATVRVLLAR